MLASFVEDLNPKELLAESTNAYFLSKRKVAQFLAYSILIVQWSILGVFMYHRANDEAFFSMDCADDGTPFCHVTNHTNTGRTLMFLILWAWTWPDILSGLLLLIAYFYKPRQYGNLRVLLTALYVAGIGNATLWTAGIYTWSTSVSDTEALLNIVGILFVLDIDEQMIKLVMRLHPKLHHAVEQEIEAEFVSNGGNDDDDDNNHSAEYSKLTATEEEKSTTTSLSQENI